MQQAVRFARFLLKQLKVSLSLGLAALAGSTLIKLMSLFGFRNVQTGGIYTLLMPQQVK